MEDLVENDPYRLKVDEGNDQNNDNIAYDYFICYKKDNAILDYMNPKDAVDLIFQVADNLGNKRHCDSDNDSEDSNRESANGNDYPDESSPDEDDEDYDSD